jgi:hypothetical protein
MLPWMSEWVIVVFDTEWAIFKIYHDKNKLYFYDEDDVHFALDQICANITKTTVHE